MAAGISGGEEQLGVEGIGSDLTTKGLPAGGSVEGEPSAGIGGGEEQIGAEGIGGDSSFCVITCGRGIGDAAQVRMGMRRVQWNSERGGMRRLREVGAGQEQREARERRERDGEQLSSSNRKNKAAAKHFLASSRTILDPRRAPPSAPRGGGVRLPWHPSAWRHARRGSAEARACGGRERRRQGVKGRDPRQCRLAEGGSGGDGAREASATVPASRGGSGGASARREGAVARREGVVAVGLSSGGIWHGRGERRLGGDKEWQRCSGCGRRIYRRPLALSPVPSRPLAARRHHLGLSPPTRSLSPLLTSPCPPRVEVRRREKRGERTDRISRSRCMRRGFIRAARSEGDPTKPSPPPLLPDDVAAGGCR
uniref:Uncharacterized protein n=1 Tax=Oryza sativa subsp. japonica TaxID=39947 RepID=Q6ER52_ORYSJ|nr:hypothetical protein [Oryza sativa Japonica Group]